MIEMIKEYNWSVKLLILKPIARLMKEDRGTIISQDNVIQKR